MITKHLNTTLDQKKNAMSNLSRSIKQKLFSQNFALFVEKVSFQLIGVAIILSLFGISLPTLIISMLLFYVSEIVWVKHPKTKKEEGISLFISGVFTIFLSTLVPSSYQLIALVLKSFGVLMMTIGALRDIWKVSAHMAGTSFIFTLASILGNFAITLSTLIILPIVGWSRIKLRRHTLAQVVVGTLIGFVIPLLFI